MIYLDNAATTRPYPSVAQAMLRALEVDFANPSSRHAFGLAARHAVEEARRTIASYVGIDPQGVVFTSGGTEANHLAALGLPLRSGTTRIVSTVAEHPSLARPLAARTLTARTNGELVRVPLTSSGVVDLERLAEVLDERVGLVAFFEGHNEIGSRNPMDEVVRLVRARAPRALIHLDSVQAFGKPTPPPFPRGERGAPGFGIDSAAVSAHKFHGPKGVGALLLRTKTNLTPQMLGGGQEHDRRSGTENVPGIVGFGEAVRLLAALTPADHARMRAQQTRLATELCARSAGARPLVPLVPAATTLPHVLALVLPEVPAEVVLHHLEAEGICASAGAACHAGSKELSPALRALGLRDDEIRGVLRLSLSRETTDAEIERVIEVLPRVVQSVRAVGAGR